MGIWDRIGSIAIGVVESAPVQSVLNMLASPLLGDKEHRRQMVFTMAMIALAAKMAKADGVVTADEVRAFEQLFELPEGQEQNVSRIFDLARHDVAGFQGYARQIAKLYAEEPAMLEDILDGLFHIAKADGTVHEAELRFLHEVGDIFGFSAAAFGAIKARHVVGDKTDPYVILGAERSLDDDALKAHYRRLVSENHPDRHIAQGMPEEFIRIATERLQAINEAYDRIRAERGLS